MSGLLVHEWFAKTGGSEKVVAQIQLAFPDADLQVLWDDREPRGIRTRETWLSRTPLRNHKALALPFEIPTWRTLRSESDYDWMLVSSHLFAHHARLARQPDLTKLVYAHTPARYIWEPSLDERGSNPLVKLAATALKPLDRRRAGEATRVAANSEFTRQRIQRSWRRDSDVIYPPVDTERIQRVSYWADVLSEGDREILESVPDSFILGASRMVPYKRLDLVIAAGEATDSPVVLAGDGPLWDTLKQRAHSARVPVHLIRQPSDELLFSLYQRARCFIFPAVEDFGIMPVEAMSAGVPVIVPAVGGAAESVRIASGGATVHSFEEGSWREAIASCDAIDRSLLPARASFFSASRFRDEIQGWVRSQADASAEGRSST
ncbi:glycosyltransferase [Microbacterium oleivorans]|uniref:D-inositol 3-phosphate glycosyltransferase n=1 Tax=Microbacterium oleivorans TaxID=273677 RepID=A0A031FXV6_9MICO|nr:glycosyltransferase [Microbacterium oleivorans]EZP29041.1 putative glycosyl transferase [Microbacterium oleivorans]